MRFAGAKVGRGSVVVALPVAGIVVVAGAAAAVFALQLSEFVIMPDELGYVKQAIVLSHGAVPTPGSFWFNSWALLHSLMLAPFYRVAATTTAWDAGRVVGAFVMASAAIPAYLLTRQALRSHGAALLVAALSVAVPWMAMAGTVMTEVVAYPAFVWVCLAMLYGIRRPGLRGDVLVAIALAIAFVARTQLLVLAPAYVLALLLDVLLRHDGSLRDRAAAAVRAHAPMIAIVMVGTLLVLATGSVRRVLGNYGDPTHGSLFPPGTGVATRELVVYVVVACGAVPLALAAAWSVMTIGRRVPHEEHALAAILLSVVPIFAVIGGSFTVRYTAGINDRYFFYVVPLLYAGAAAAILRPRRRQLAALLVTGALTIWLIASASISQSGPSLVSPTMAWHTWLAERAAEVGTSMPHLVAVGTAIVLVGVVVAMRLLRPVVALGVVAGTLLVWGVVQTAYTFDKVAATQRGVSPLFLSQRGWVDRALPKNGRAISILASLGDPVTTTATWWDTSYWNKSVDRVMTVGRGDSYSQGFYDALTVDRATGRVPALDRYQYVVRYVNDTRFGLRGSHTVAGFGGISVLTAQRPYQADWYFEGPDPNVAVVPTGASGSLRVFPPPGAGSGPVRVTLAAVGPKPVKVSLVAGQDETTARIARSGRASVTLPARLFGPGNADVQVRVSAGQPKGSSVTLVEATRG